MPLLGIPLAHKDIIATAGVRTTAGSRVRASHVPEEDAAVVTMLRQAGAIILGKTNLMEFAYAYPHPDFGETRNPWATERTAGGSSAEDPPRRLPLASRMGRWEPTPGGRSAALRPTAERSD
jgi:aspartyl-tRNA(Asn)/glutamyl-tRNA(Gln) amidotransferase subunit A